MDYQRFLLVKTQQSTDPNMTIEFVFKMFFDWCILRTMEKSNESSEHERKTIGRFTQILKISWSHVLITADSKMIS